MRYLFAVICLLNAHLCHGSQYTYDLFDYAVGVHQLGDIGITHCSLGHSCPNIDHITNILRG